jgi:uncharacterized protein YbaP (TraB family)
MLVIAMLFLTEFQAERIDTGADSLRNEAGGALEEVIVRGVQPGPALWRVSSGDHVLWILGEVSPLPAKVKWRSKQLEHLLANSQEVLLDFADSPSPTKDQVGAYVRARKLPDGVSLKDLVSPELYARVEATSRVFGASKRFQEMRPFNAANSIFTNAVKSLNLVAFSASLEVAKLAQKAGVKITSLSTPGQTFDEFLFNLEHASTVPCLESLVDIVGDRGKGLRRLANAWSVGDINKLRQLGSLHALSEGHTPRKCTIAIYGGEQQANDYFARRAGAWLLEAERALRENQRTIAVVQLEELFAADGYVARLRAKGYEVEEPH